MASASLGNLVNLLSRISRDLSSPDGSAGSICVIYGFGVDSILPLSVSLSPALLAIILAAQVDQSVNLEGVLRFWKELVDQNQEESRSFLLENDVSPPPPRNNLVQIRVA